MAVHVVLLVRGAREHDVARCQSNVLHGFFLKCIVWNTLGTENWIDSFTKSLATTRLAAMCNPMLSTRGCPFWHPSVRKIACPSMCWEGDVTGSFQIEASYQDFGVYMIPQDR